MTKFEWSVFLEEDWRAGGTTRQLHRARSEAQKHAEVVLREAGAKRASVKIIKKSLKEKWEVILMEASL